MSGNDCVNLNSLGISKVSKKISFFEKIYESYLPFLRRQFPDIPFRKENILVIFIFNGADQVQVDRDFQSPFFRTSTIYFPDSQCLSWFEQLKREKAETALGRTEVALGRTEVALTEAKALAEERLRILQETEEELRKLKEQLKSSGK